MGIPHRFRIFEQKFRTSPINGMISLIITESSIEQLRPCYKPGHLGNPRWWGGGGEERYSIRARTYLKLQHLRNVENILKTMENRFSGR